MSDPTKTTRKRRAPLPFSNENPGGIAWELALAKSMLRRAMQHGINGSDGYDAIKASDLGDEVRAYLKEVEHD